jgi:hypothetical protein
MNVHLSTETGTALRRSASPPDNYRMDSFSDRSAGLQNEMRRVFCNRACMIGLGGSSDLRAILNNLFPVRNLRLGSSYESLAQTRDFAASGSAQTRLHDRTAASQRTVWAPCAALLLHAMQMELHGLREHSRGPRRRWKSGRRRRKSPAIQHPRGRPVSGTRSFRIGGAGRRRRGTSASTWQTLRT